MILKARKGGEGRNNRWRRGEVDCGVHREIGGWERTSESLNGG